MVSRREDWLSLELYITLACMAAIIGTVLLAIGVFSDWPLEIRALRAATGLLLLYGCYRAARVALHRLRVRRAARLTRANPDRLREDVIALLRAGRPIGAVHLYSKATGVGLAKARRVVEALQRQDRRGD